MQWILSHVRRLSNWYKFLKKDCEKQTDVKASLEYLISTKDDYVYDILNSCAYIYVYIYIYMCVCV